MQGVFVFCEKIAFIYFENFILTRKVSSDVTRIFISKRGVQEITYISGTRCFF